MLPCDFRIPSFNGTHLLRRSQIFRPISSVSFSTSPPLISTYDFLVNHHNFSPKSAAIASSSTKFLPNPQNADSLLNFLKEIGFPKNHIETLVQKSPGVLSVKFERTFKPKIKVFQDLGFHSTDIAEILSAYPWHLRSSSSTLRQNILGFENVLGRHADISMFLKSSTSGRTVSHLYRKVVPNIEYLKSCGICPLQIAEHVFKYPQIYTTNTEKFKGHVAIVAEMGIPIESKNFFSAIWAMCLMTRKKWELKLKLFRALGFSEQDILHAFRKAPRVFAVSETKIKEVTRLLLSVVDIAYIVRNPQLLTYSAQKRIKPRLVVLEALESNSLLQTRPCFTSFFQMTDVNFIDKYVTPHLEEVGDLYVVKQGLCSKDSALLIKNS